MRPAATGSELPPVASQRRRAIKSLALGRIEKTSGVYSDVAVFDSNLECPSAQPALECIGNNATVWRMGKPLSHTFDFEHYAYTVYGRVYRTFGYLKPILIQLRLNAQ